MSLIGFLLLLLPLSIRLVFRILLRLASSPLLTHSRAFYYIYVISRVLLLALASLVVLTLIVLFASLFLGWQG